MNRVILTVILLCVTFLGRILYAQASPATSSLKIYVGFLDDDRKEMANWKPGVSHQRLIRPAFEKIGSAWHVAKFSSLPRRMQWAVAFNGRNLGHVESEANLNGAEPEQSNIGFLTLTQGITTPAAAIPSVGVPSSRYAGLIAMGPGKVRRPLVVVSKPYVSDPDIWKRLPQPPHEIARQVRAAFRRDFPHVNRCQNEEVLQHGWNFPDSSLKLPIVYASNKNSFLIQTSLNAGDCGYVDDPNDPLSEPWFFASADGSVQRIGSFMSLLDAGDYDNDGRSELIFFLSRPEDTDGFILFDAHLHRQASFLWSYH